MFSTVWETISTAGYTISTMEGNQNHFALLNIFILFLGTSRQLGTIIEGESLLNDGCAIVLFNMFFALAFEEVSSKPVIVLSLGTSVHHCVQLKTPLPLRKTSK